MNIEYVDILTGENFRQFRLLQWTAFIGRFDHPVGGRGKGLRGWRRNRYFSKMEVLIRVHENLVQHTSNCISNFFLLV